MRWFTVSRIERASVTKMACSGHSIAEVGAPPVNARAVHGRGREDLSEETRRDRTEGDKVL